jgi:hypothetical protein
MELFNEITRHRKISWQGSLIMAVTETVFYSSLSQLHLLRVLPIIYNQNKIHLLVFVLFYNFVLLFFRRGEPKPKLHQNFNPEPEQLCNFHSTRICKKFPLVEFCLVINFGKFKRQKHFFALSVIFERFTSKGTFVENVKKSQIDQPYSIYTILIFFFFYVY